MITSYINNNCLGMDPGWVLQNVRSHFDFYIETF